jgi:hypothetical protein
MTPISAQAHAFSPLGRGDFNAECPCARSLKNGLTIRVIKNLAGWADAKNVETTRTRAAVAVVVVVPRTRDSGRRKLRRTRCVPHRMGRLDELGLGLAASITIPATSPALPDNRPL